MSLILHISPPSQHTVTRCKIKFNYDNIHNHIVLLNDLFRLQPDLRGETNQKTLRGQPVRTIFITQKPLLKTLKSPRNIKIKKTPRNTQKYQKKRSFIMGHQTASKFYTFFQIFLMVK